MVDEDISDPQFNTMTARLLRREALRRAAQELDTATGLGLEGVVARISAEVTAEAVAGRQTGQASISPQAAKASLHAAPVAHPPAQVPGAPASDCAA